MRSLYIVLALVAGASCLVHGTRTKRCGRGHHVGESASCDREGAVLERVSRRCRVAVEHPSFRGTAWAARLRQRWDGTVHQLVDAGHAPAVTTEKKDIRVCLDGHPSEDALVFVCLHEIAHVASETLGHTEEFWRCFDAVLKAARRAGVYTRHDPSQHVCGSSIGPATPGFSSIF